MKKVILSVSVSALGLSGTVNAATIAHADPAPAGISYEWTVTLGKKDEAELIRHVSAKSWHEAPPGYTEPDVGWTHTSDWIAVELTDPAKLEICLQRQQGVTTAGPNLSNNLAGDKLYPAFSYYSGWDDTSTEDHRYNPMDDITWSTVQYLGHKDNPHGKSEVCRTTKKLEAGRYSIAVGGANFFFCAAADPCYGGRHGYELKLETKPVGWKDD